jgi:hypothetical protein
VDAPIPMGEWIEVLEAVLIVVIEGNVRQVCWIIRFLCASWCQ